MLVQLEWKEKMKFDCRAGQNLVAIDAKAPVGASSAQTPKELVVSGLAGCTAMDVSAYLRKHKQEPSSFTIKAEVSQTEKGHPAVFTKAHLTFVLEGNVDPEKALEAVQLSQTQYCGVSAMLAKAFPITWELFVNQQRVGQGEAKFN